MIAGCVNNTVTTGLVILLASASCPTGYARVASMDNKFLQANTICNVVEAGASRSLLNQ